MALTDESSRTREIVETIISGINKGTFMPGERVPSQREMAELFGVSRTVIREAVKILEGRGIVHSKKGSGIYVCALPVAAEGTHVERISSLDVSLREILEFGNMVWYEAARLMTLNAEDSEIEILARLTGSFHKRYSGKTTLQERYIYETTFGLKIAQLSHNALMHKLMVELFSLLSEIDHKVVEDADCYREILEVDAKIVEALQERDVERVQYMNRERMRLISLIMKADPSLLAASRQIHLGLTLSNYIYT